MPASAPLVHGRYDQYGRCGAGSHRVEQRALSPLSRLRAFTGRLALRQGLPPCGALAGGVFGAATLLVRCGTLWYAVVRMCWLT